MVEYTYDTWGKKVTTTGTLAGTLGLFQPFRYRGYVYDWETGFYYLQSRYYDPTTGRFISADVLLSTGQGVLGHNCYAYCLDNPVNYEDPAGQAGILNKIKDFFTQVVYGAGGSWCGGHIWGSNYKSDPKDEWQDPQDQIKSDPEPLSNKTTQSLSNPIQSSPDQGYSAGISFVGNEIQTYYPPNNGFDGAIQQVTLDTGTVIQRTGNMFGRFAAPAGTPNELLSLPYNQIGQSISFLEVAQPLPALAGKAASWFGQIGGGTQYMFEEGIHKLIEDGFLKPLQ